MAIESTPAFVATVGEDRIITLPPETPVGTIVAVVVLTNVTEEAARKRRFAATMDAIRQAMAGDPGTPISDDELDRRIRAARQRATPAAPPHGSSANS